MGKKKDKYRSHIGNNSMMQQRNPAAYQEYLKNQGYKNKKEAEADRKAWERNSRMQARSPGGYDLYKGRQAAFKKEQEKRNNDSIKISKKKEERGKWEKNKASYEKTFQADQKKTDSLIKEAKSYKPTQISASSSKPLTSKDLPDRPTVSNPGLQVLGSDYINKKKTKGSYGDYTSYSSKTRGWNKMKSTYSSAPIQGSGKKGLKKFKQSVKQGLK